MTETEIGKIEAYLGPDFETKRRIGQGWEIWHNDRVIALITDEAILRAYMPGKKYTHGVDCLRHPDNEKELDAYYDSYDMFPDDCDCPWVPTPPLGFSIIEVVLRRVKERIEERKMMKLRQVGRMCGSDPNV